MDKINISKQIEYLLQFAKEQLLIEDLDIITCRNALLDLFEIQEPYFKQVEKNYFKSPVSILEKLLDYGYEIGLIPENTNMYRDLLDAKIMGLLMPRQSEVVKNFWDTARNYGVRKATDNFYNLSKSSNYIRMDRIEKNLYWRTNTEYGYLEITINLSKPEKDPKEIVEEKSKINLKYPKCLLCVDNIGYCGREGYPARQNHRVIPIKLKEEQWYLQYSPYVYYNEHCILLKAEHVPMTINKKTFIRLLDFVEQIPHYFIGSNADIPIVGGSILSHEHFQGGRHTFPMAKASIESSFKHNKYQKVTIGILKWPMSVIRVSSADKDELISVCNEILTKWKLYDDVEANILCCTKNDKDIIWHNTITPIARKINDKFQVDLVLRNNRTNKEYPYGIFHPHENLHHIKKENIGLIEVMGLGVLPARLSKELSKIKSILIGDMQWKQEEIQESNELYKHKMWIDELVKKYGTKCDRVDVDRIIQKEVGTKFLNVLLDAGVYKRDEVGRKQFIRFMEYVGFKSK